MDKNRYNKLDRLLTLIDLYKKYKIENSIKFNSKSPKRFDSLFSDLKKIKSQVFDKRYNEAKVLFEKKRSYIQISSFELMEHDFFENSHTNILQYLFDFRLSGNLGIKLFKHFIEKIDKPEARSIIPLIENSTYYTKREFSLDGGRMDLLIVDEKSKFVVMIENKLLADVMAKEDDEEIEELEEKQITRTQLTIYKKYLENYYPDYKRLLILLSYKQQDLVDEDYIVLDYKFLFRILQYFNEKDNILSEYKLLLRNILNNKENNIYTLELGYNLIHNKYSISLNDIETLKNMCYEN